MEQDIAGQRTGADPGQFGMHLQALQGDARAGIRVHVRRAINRADAELVLDVEGQAVGDGVGARFRGAEIAERLRRHGPGALGLAADADGDHRLDPRHDIGRPVAWRANPVDRLQVGNARSESALLQAVGQDRFLGGDLVDLGSFLRHRNSLSGSGVCSGRLFRTFVQGVCQLGAPAFWASEAASRNSRRSILPLPGLRGISVQK